MENIQNSEAGVSILLMAVSALFLLLAAFIVLFVVMYQKKLIKKQLEYRLGLLEAALQAQENERKRIARDLHDDVGAMLSSVKLNIGKIGLNVEKSIPIPAGLTQETKLLIDEAIANNSRISKGLLPVALEEYGLAEALQCLCSRASDSSGIAVGFWHEGNGQRYDSKIETALYRMAQELVNNSIKHSKADKIKVALKTEPGRIVMTAGDNGKGFDPKEEKKRPPEKRGLGLRNLESRMSIINGDMIYSSAGGAGTEVTIYVKT